ncbi:MAG: hypothetical protein K2X87_17890 [Gemmataceae bacterium]|nr:hypothetical protein [Gemmataceae bacterium]
MTATEPTAAPPTPSVPAEPPFAVTRAEWQRLLDRLAEQEATIRQLTQHVENLRARVEPQWDRSAGVRNSEYEPAIASAAAFEAEIDELLAHRAAHPADRWVAYRGPQRLRFGPTGYALHQELIREYPDGEFSLFGIEASVKYPNDTVV